MEIPSSSNKKKFMWRSRVSVSSNPHARRAVCCICGWLVWTWHFCGNMFTAVRHWLVGAGEFLFYPGIFERAGVLVSRTLRGSSINSRSPVMIDFYFSLGHKENCLFPFFLFLCRFTHISQGFIRNSRLLSRQLRFGAHTVVLPRTPAGRLILPYVQCHQREREREREREDFDCYCQAGVRSRGKPAKRPREKARDSRGVA